MPRIEDAVLDAVIYLYPSVQSAKDGDHTGGSGFLASVPSRIPTGAEHVYAITNKHVLDHGARVIRLNTQDGGFDVVETERADWMDHPDGDDVSVMAIDLAAFHSFQCIPADKFLTQQDVQQYNIGPGDEVMLVGRLITAEGRQRNLPSVRFGNIAMMPWEPVPHPSGHMQESFLVDMRSIAGYSGSPAFVFPMRLGFQYYGDWFLGIDWGHTIRKKPVLDEFDELVNAWHVESDTGIAQVIPAWRLMDLLNDDELRIRRDAKERGSA